MKMKKCIHPLSEVCAVAPSVLPAQCPVISPLHRMLALRDRRPRGPLMEQQTKRLSANAVKIVTFTNLCNANFLQGTFCFVLVNLEFTVSHSQFLAGKTCLLSSTQDQKTSAFNLSPTFSNIGDNGTVFIQIFPEGFPIGVCNTLQQEV